MPNAIATRALDACDSILAGGVVPAETYSMPTMIPAPDGSLILIPDYGANAVGGPSVATWKTVWTFRGPQGSTWSESYHTTSGADPSDVANVYPSLKNARLAFLHPLCTLNNIRASDVTNNRVTYVQFYGAAGTFSGEDESAPDVAGTAAKYVHFGQNPAWASVPHFYRGIPDGQVQLSTVNGVARIPPLLNPLIKAWHNALVGRGYGILSLAKRDNAAPVTLYNKIVSVATTSGGVLVTCAGPVLLPSGGSLKVTQADEKTLPALNGQWTPTASAGNTFTIPYVLGQAGPITINAGRIRVVTYAPFNSFRINQCYFDSFTTRRTKNAYTPSRRKRSVVKIRTLA